MRERERARERERERERERPWSALGSRVLRVSNLVKTFIVRKKPWCEGDSTQSRLFVFKAQARGEMREGCERRGW